MLCNQAFLDAPSALTLLLVLLFFCFLIIAPRKGAIIQESPLLIHLFSLPHWVFSAFMISMNQTTFFTLSYSRITNSVLLLFFEGYTSSKPRRTTRWMSSGPRCACSVRRKLRSGRCCRGYSGWNTISRVSWSPAALRWIAGAPSRKTPRF